jgi:hypothetical protein
MKAFLFITLSFLITTTIFSQQFDTPNQFQQIKSMLYLRNGDSILGQLSIDMNKSIGKAIRIKALQNGDVLKYTIKEVKGYRINNEVYTLKEVKNNSISIGNGQPLLGQMLTKKESFFMKRLTPENSRIHLFENTIIEPVRENGNTVGGRRVINHYIELQDANDLFVHSLDDRLFVPDFNAKMSAIVKDCPQLSMKIANKEKGYFYAQVNLVNEIRSAIMLNIIEEYNKCQ